MTGSFHFCVWDRLLPLAETPGRRDERLLVSLPEDKQCEVNKAGGQLKPWSLSAMFSSREAVLSF